MLSGARHGANVSQQNHARANGKRATRLVGFVFALGFALGAPSTSQALPVQYDFSAGYVTLWATVGGDVLIDPVTVGLDGVQVTVDTALDQLVDMQLTAPGPLDLTLNQLYSGYDEITIESLDVSGGPGSLFLVDAGPPSEYFYLINPLTLDLEISADGPAPSQGPIANEHVISDTVATGTLFLDTAANALTLTGLTLGSFDLGTGETPIVIKGDFIYTGTSEAPIPEPSAALGFLTIMATFAGAHLRSRRNASAR